MARKIGCFFLAILFLLMVLFLAAPAVKAAGAEAKDWDIVFQETSRYLRGTKKSPGRTDGFLRLLDQIRSRAGSAREKFSEEILLYEKRLEAIGPPPAEGAPPEAREIASERRRQQSLIASARARVVEADLAIVRAMELEDALGDLKREQVLGRMYRRAPIPVMPEVILKGGAELLATLGRIARSPWQWRAGLPKGAEGGAVWLPGAVILIFGAFLGWGIRRSVLDMFGRAARIPAPSYARRIGAAIAEGAGNGAFPGAVLIACYLWATRPGTPVTGLFGEALASLILAGLVFCFVVAFARAFLSPGWPAWRFTAQSTENALSVYRRTLGLSAVFCADMFLAGLLEARGRSPEAAALYAAVFGTLEGGIFAQLCRGALWRADVPKAALERDASEADVSGEEQTRRERIWRLLRRAARFLALVGVAALFAGYADFGRYLITNLILSGFLLLAIALMQEALNEAVSWSTRSEFIVKKTHLSQAMIRAIRSWEPVLVAPLVFLLGLVAIAPVWGVPPGDVIGWILGTLSGFQVGSIRISIADIVLAIAVFFIAMGAARFLQRQLSERLLARSNLPFGIRHSLNAGAGYAGVILAVLLSVSVTGINLSNLALLASALSVGIGFGLQNVVNNFVSGLILLVERPIQAEDWVRVGEHEGIVKQIKFRATELQTWQRASVIIPNAEIISTPVINLTHRGDDYGRIEIGVGVAYGSDVRKVEAILLEVAAQNEQVSGYPEPFALFRDFGASSLDFELRCFTPDVKNRLRVASAIRFEIERRLREEGIEIPFPQRVVHLAGPKEGSKEDTGAGG